ncbi:MAG: VOC family protein [Alkalilacustris sp.]
MTAPDPHPVAGIDHVFLLVHDLDHSRDTYARLGFTVSPRGLHSAHKGAANHTIMFPDDYLELLGLIAETEANAGRRAALATMGEGLHAVACRIADAHAARAALSAHGIATEAVGSFSRPVPLPDGSQAMASFNTLAFEGAEVPLGTCFMCQHLTRDAVWVPSLLEHPNTACGLGRVIARTDDPEAAARGYARLFAAGRARPTANGWEVETGAVSAAMAFMAPAELLAIYPELDLDRTPEGAFAALQVRVRDLDRTRAVLASAGVPHRTTPDGVAVPARAACGTVLEFVPA